MHLPACGALFYCHFLPYVKSQSAAKDSEIQKYFLCEIYLIEEDYKMAYTYLKDCRYVGVLQEYDYELRRYSSSKYRKHILKEPLFNIKSRAI